MKNAEGSTYPELFLGLKASELQCVSPPYPQEKVLFHSPTNSCWVDPVQVLGTQTPLAGAESADLPLSSGFTSGGAVVRSTFAWVPL